MTSRFFATACPAIAVAVFLAAPAAAQSADGRGAAAAPRAVADTGGTVDVLGKITDSTTGGPLSGADIEIRRGGRIVARSATNALGGYRIHDIRSGQYTVEARFVGFRPDSQQVAVGASGGLVDVSFRLVPATIELSAIEVAATPIAVDTRTGNQVFQQDAFQGAPTLTTSQIVQQAIAGAARAPTGEVHIRGQHAEYTYYVDGVPIPPGISGSLNELFDPSVVNQINFQTGSWDAEYGGRNAAVINVQTRIPSGGFHSSLSSYVGTYGADGQSFTASSNAGKLGWFLAGTRTETDMRREPLMADTNASGAITGIRNLGNYGNDAYGFGKLQYTPSDRDVMTLDLNWSRTGFEIPYDSGVGRLNDHQTDLNDFASLAWSHESSTGPDRGTQLFASAFYRHGSLSYAPGATDQPAFTFAPDTARYDIAEARSFDIVGLKLDYTVNLSEALSLKVGTLSTYTSGHENFHAFNATNPNGPASNSPLNGSDVGVYAQARIQPTDHFELRAGLRFDDHRSPVSPTQSSDVSQLSPRVRLSWFPTPATTLWAYYGRQFIPTNVEDLRAITSAAQGGTVSAPTLPERDDFYELGVTHRFESGVVVKLSAYRKNSSPGTDDTQVPGSSISTDVNIARVRVTGIETVVEIRPSGGPWSGFVNLALCHAYGSGAVTGGFFAVAPPRQTFDLDHDQRISATAGVTYGAGGWLLSATGIYGSGLTNGVTPNTPGRPNYDATMAATGPLGTGLLDFNSAFKVKPSFIVNASAGYTFIVGRTEVRPQLFVTNVFDLKYALKGQFFSGASIGRPRTLEFRLSVGV